MKHLSAEGIIYQCAYRLQRHYLFGWSATRWLVIGLLLLPAGFYFNLLPGEWPAAGAAATVSLSLIFILWLAKRRNFLRFEAHPPGSMPVVAPAPLTFTEKLPLRASGTFAVGDMSRYFVEETARYQVFETRERAIHLFAPPSRLLLLALSPRPEIGWWYTFFTPQTLQTIEAGRLVFGSRPRPALRLTVRPDAAELPRVLHLSFDSPEQQTLVLADLRADGGGVS